MTINGSFCARSRFYPDEHFPHGIARSGEFLITHAELLERHGKAYQALHAGIRKPTNEEEMRFLEVCRGERSASTYHEKAWERYCLMICKKPSVSPFTQCSPNSAKTLMEETTPAEGFTDE